MGIPDQPQQSERSLYSRIADYFVPSSVADSVADNYRSLEEVTKALERDGLKSCKLIFGIDFTKSNERTGAKSYNKRSLHYIGVSYNPYEHAISIIGKTLAPLDADNLISCYGFGDESTKDQEVFSFYPDERLRNGFMKVLKSYKEIVPQLQLAGPTSFAPVIEMAMTIVEQSGGQYHVLVIIADGQVTGSVDTEDGQLSPQEWRTVEAIAQASFFPLSIILVGVGDGPWDMMKEFEDNIPARAFNNFQFVNFTEIMSKNVSPSLKETEFARAALMEIPSHYKATLKLNILGGRKGNAPERVPLPPPMYGAASSSSSKPLRAPSFPQSFPSSLQSSPSFPPSSPYSYGQDSPVGTAPPVTSSTFDNQVIMTKALARAALESSNLIVCIDFTKSNEWTGAKSYDRRSLHHIGVSLNPYEQAISIIGKTLAAFDNSIPCYGFGDASTQDQEVFSFFPDERFCNGFTEVLNRYREIVPHLQLAGPTSFAPVIEMAMTIVEQSGGQYHVLVIIADGQVHING